MTAHPKASNRRAGACAFAVCLLALASHALAQAPAGELTVLTSPAEARLTLWGPSDIVGTAPLDLPSTWIGVFKVRVEAPGYARANGLIELPARSFRPTLISERPGISPGLLVRSLNFPGVPALSSGHKERGLAFLTAGVGGLAATARDHFRYRDKLQGSDVDSEDRAKDFHYARNRWAAYTGAVWGLSAIDYIIRARIDLVESTPTRITVAAPKLHRTSVVWRSILVPGAGQDYANRNMRGFGWLGITLASGAAWTIAEESHHRIETKLARAESLLAVAGPTEIFTRQANVQHFQSLQETSKQLRDGLMIATGTLYLANVLDAATIPLTRNEEKKAKLSLAAPFRPREPMLALQYRF